MRKTFLTLITILTLFLILPITVMAQQVTLSLSPPLVELFAKPGKSVLVAYNLENLADPTILAAKVLPFSALGNQGAVKIKKEFEGPIRFSLDNSDLTLNQAFFLKTKDSQQLLLRIRIPEGTPEGDYYYTLLVETKPTILSQGETLSSAKATIGSHILITVSQSGLVDIKGKVAVFDVFSRYQFNLFGRTLKILESTDKIPVFLILENQGKNLIKPQGEITLLGNFGERAKYEILPQNILSQSERLIQATPSAEIECDHRREQACLFPTSLIISGFFLGKYRLSTTINFGEGTPNVYANATFYALPIKFIIAILISIIVVVFIIKRVKE
jgi:hypothetical protein